MDSFASALQRGLSDFVLNSPVVARLDYPFFVPFGSKPRDEVVSFALFSSPIPSIDSAFYGFFDYGEQKVSDAAIRDLAALGAKNITVISENNIRDIYFESLDNHVVVNREVKTDLWLQRKIREIPNLLDNVLGFDLTKSLIVQAAKNSLIDRLNALFSLLTRNEGLNDSDALKVSFEILNSLMLDIKSEDPIINLYSERLRSSTSFENIPPATLAEAYERFGISDQKRRSSGVVYTPDWLAKFAVAQIPSNIIKDHSMRIEDPACGSGTFLVAAIERLAKDMNSIEFKEIQLSRRVKGRDIDPLAVYITILSLNYLAKQSGIPHLDWDVRVADSTAEDVDCEWVIGNLPFGYRSHGAYDVSSIILNKIIQSKSVRGLSLIMPESFTYNKKSLQTRINMLNIYQINELYLIPDHSFNSGTERTVLIEASIGNKKTFKLRILSKKLKDKYQTGTKPTRFASITLPEVHPYVIPISPLSEVVNRIYSPRHLKDSFDVWTGTQFYGKEDAIANSKADLVPVLVEPSKFWNYNSLSESVADYVPDASELFLMRGPWDLRSRPKIILRSTVRPRYRSRLAGILDKGSLAFIDKFIGIWSKNDDINNLKLLILFLQNDFSAAWIRANNPNRKLRKFILEKLPIPDFSSDQWAQIRENLPEINLIYTADENEHQKLLARDEVLLKYIEIVYEKSKTELGISEEAALVFSLINEGEVTDRLIDSVRDFQLIREYHDYSYNITNEEKDFLSYAGTNVIGDFN